jgi:hypothetical protein
MDQQVAIVILLVHLSVKAVVAEEHQHKHLVMAVHIPEMVVVMVVREEILVERHLTLVVVEELVVTPVLVVRVQV